MKLLRDLQLKHLTIFCLLVWALPGHAQVIVRGQVSDIESGATLPGTTVLEKGTQNGTVTDVDGRFQLEVSSEATLVVSYIGYLSQEIKIGSQTNFMVSMRPNMSELQEIVIIGYGTQKRSEITGAVAVTTANELDKLPAPRLEQVLQGRTSGVQITQSSGSPGNGLSVRVRGIGTPNNSDPLYVIDGVWFDAVDFLNPADIETISVLKDAASAAIYGANGANGVVLITTKTGKQGQKGKISYDAYFGTQYAPKPRALLNASQYAELMLEANGGQFASSDVRSILNNPQSLGEGTDWQAAIFAPAPIQSHQINISGGTTSSDYSVMGSYFQQDGIIGGKKSGYERYTLRIKTNQQVNKVLKFGQNINLTALDRASLAENNEFASPVAFAQNLDPVTPIYKDDGTFNFSRLVVGDLKNPLNRIDKFHSSWNSNQVVGNVYAELTPVKGLRLRTSGSLDINFARNFSFTEKYNLDPSLLYVHEQNLQNGVFKSREKWTNAQWENLISYDFEKGSHAFTLLAGTTYRDRKYETLGVGLTNLIFNSPDSAYIYGLTLDLPSDSLGNHKYLNAFEGLSESTLISYFTRLDYGFANKYFASATLRRDGSSRFGANNKYAVFPSVSLGWLISGEEAFTLPAAINFAKLRASYGQNGNEKIDDYGFVGTINNGAGAPAIRYVFGTGQNIYQGAAPTSPANPDRKWEVSTQTNIGLDLAFLHDKLQFTTDFFIKRTTDLLIQKEEPALIGTGVNHIEVPFVNAGEILNRGWEFMMTYNHKVGDFKMDVNLNATFIKNKVVDLGLISTPISSGFNQGVGGSITRMEEGQPFGYFYGYKTLGIFQNKFEVEEYRDATGRIIQPGAVPGDFRFADLDGDGRITSEDRTIIGNPYPDMILGLSSNISYKIFDLSVFFQGSFGNEIFNATTRWDAGVQNQPINRLDRWTESNPSNTEPRAVINDTNGNFRVSDYFVEDGSFIRLKNIQLGISLPQVVAKKIFAERARVYVNVQNLFTLTKYSGLDPEIGKANAFSNDQSSNLNFGIDRGFYPQARTFTTGLNITF